MVMIAMLFEGNEKVQKAVYKFVTTNGNEGLFVYLKETMFSTFERLFLVIVEQSLDDKVKQEFTSNDDKTSKIKDGFGEEDDEDAASKEKDRPKMRSAECDDATWMR